MQIRPDRTERSMRVLLFLALLLGVGWAMLGDAGRAEPAAAIAGVPGQ